MKKIMVALLAVSSFAFAACAPKPAPAPALPTCVSNTDPYDGTPCQMP